MSVVFLHKTFLASMRTAGWRMAIINLFLSITKIIITTTMLAKVIALIQHPKLMEVSDVVTTLKFSNLLIVCIAIEGILVLILFSAPVYSKLFCILYFSLITGAYRIVSHIAGQYWCPCLGGFANWAALNEGQVSDILNGVTLFFFFGSITCLFYFWKDPRTLEKI